MHCYVQISVHTVAAVSVNAKNANEEYNDNNNRQQRKKREKS